MGLGGGSGRRPEIQGMTLLPEQPLDNISLLCVQRETPADLRRQTARQTV